MKHLTAALAAALALTACSLMSSKTSNVMQIGKDSYTVRSISPRSTSQAKMQALAEANSFCKSAENGAPNRSVMLVREFAGLESETNEKFYDLTFMCLAQGDKDFTRIKRPVDLSVTEPAAPADFQ